MAQQVGSRRSLIVSLILTIAIAFGSLVATLSLDGVRNLAWTWPVASRWSTTAPTPRPPTCKKWYHSEQPRQRPRRVGGQVNLQGKNVVVSVPVLPMPVVFCSWSVRRRSCSFVRCFVKRPKPKRPMLWRSSHHAAVAIYSRPRIWMSILRRRTKQQYFP